MKPATSASFKKGQSGNPKGKPKGTPNKVSREVKEILRDAFDGNAERVKAELAALEGKEFFEALSKILPYFVAKAESTMNLKTDDNSPFTILVKRARD